MARTGKIFDFEHSPPTPEPGAIALAAPGSGVLFVLYRKRTA